MFHKKLQDLRKKFGLSQEQFAEEIGFSQAAISAWENNTRDPGIKALVSIAQYFNTSVDSLVKEENSHEKTTKNEFSFEERELIKWYREINPYFRRQLIEYTRYLHERSLFLKKKHKEF